MSKLPPHPSGQFSVVVLEDSLYCSCCTRVLALLSIAALQQSAAAALLLIPWAAAAAPTTAFDAHA